MHGAFYQPLHHNKQHREEAEINQSLQALTCSENN